MQALKIVFAGTPPFAAWHLETLLGTSHQVIGVYTQPDRASGRGKQLQPSAVKSVALSHGLPVYQPASLRSPEEQQILAALQPDVMIVVAYGLLLPQAVLDIPRFGCINVHASLLPRWRGAAPIERALLAGDDKTGITIMQMDKGLDTGAMLYRKSLDISATDDRQTLETRLAEIGREGLVHCLDNLQEIRNHAQVQDDSLSTYAHKLEKNESLIDWSKDAETVNRQIRSGIGRTPAFSFLQGERIRLLQALPQKSTANVPPGTIVEASKNALRVACQESVLDVTWLQIPGKNAMHIRDILNSRKELFAPGQHFSNSEPTTT